MKTKMPKRDELKPLSEILEPDNRNQFWNVINQSTGEERPIVLEDHYRVIEQFSLHDSVPGEVATQFDVARNIYIYAWYEYRFYNVSEMQVLTVLELTLRQRISKQELKIYIKARKEKAVEDTGKKLHLSDGMKTLIEYCADNGLIQSSKFTAWHRQPELKAKQEYLLNTIAKMKETGDEECELDYSKLEIPKPDDSYDHVQHLIDHVNKIRNSYAYASADLYPNVLSTF